MQLNHKFSKKTAIRSTGFTILELMIIVVVIGIICAIASPSWFNFIERQRLNTAQNELYQALQSAKNNSTKKN
jgi:Tfp pilus assembly protein PilE